MLSLTLELTARVIDRCQSSRPVLRPPLNEALGVPAEGTGYPLPADRPLAKYPGPVVMLYCPVYGKGN